MSRTKDYVDMMQKEIKELAKETKFPFEFATDEMRYETMCLIIERYKNARKRIAELEEELKLCQKLHNELFLSYEKLKDKNEELEEQLKKAITLPVKIGDKIYVVPSETNFKINNIHHKERNRIYEWEVHEIRFSKYGYAVVSWIDNIPFFCVDVETGKYDCGTYKTERFYGETWFKTKEEAQAKLKELQGENDVKD